jgi:putative transposase
LKKALKPAIKRELVSYLTAQFAMSLRQACRTLSLSRTVFRYQPDTRRDEPVIMALTVAAERYPRYGFKSFFRYCAGRATPGTIKEFTVFTAC